MLNEVSCWYFDWATVGTWIGGLGAAAAAWAAVWAVKQEGKRRAKFAAFLFERDLIELRALVPVLNEFAGCLDEWETPNEDEHALTKNAMKNRKNQIKRVVAQLKYFSSEAEQFEYRPKCQAFYALRSMYEELLTLDDDIQEVWYSNDVDAAFHCVIDVSKRLESALNQWSALKGSKVAC